MASLQTLMRLLIKIKNESGKRKTNNQMDGFKITINNCAFQNLGYMRPQFTWYNNIEGEACTSKQLDRFLATITWSHQYLDAFVTHYTAAHLDHLPIWVKLEPSFIQLLCKKRFHFEVMWVGQEECQHIIKSSWIEDKRLLSLDNVQHGIDVCSQCLETWNRGKFNNFYYKLQHAQTKL